MQPILAHKGRLAVRVTARGRTGHSSDPARGVNAVHAAAEAVAWVAAEARRLAAEGPFEGGFDPPPRTVPVGPVGGGTLRAIIPAPGLSLDAGHELAALVGQLTGTNSTGKVSYGTEAGLYQAAGIPTVVCGPGHIGQAHQADEWIAQSELDACDAFIRRRAARRAA